MKLFLTMLIGLLCLACTPFGGFKPPPDAWTYYRGAGMDEREVYFVLMECGWPYPGDLTYVPREVKEQLGIDFKNTIAGVRGFSNMSTLTSKCMANSGFPSSGYDICRGWKDTKTGKHVPNDEPACQPNAVIPVRSVSNRINSRYCKEYPNAKACQP